MKTTLTRAVCATLALLCLLSLAACSKKPSGIPAPEPLSPNVENKPATVTAYVKENLALLDEVVAHISAREGLSYYYFVRDEDKSIHIQELINKNGQLERKNVKDATLEKLAATGFVGELTYSETSTRGIVSFYTYISGDSVSRLFVWCPDQDTVNFLCNGFFKGADHVTATKIEEHWYYVEAQ